VAVGQQKPVKVVADVDSGQRIGREASGLFDLFLRRIVRLLGVYRRDGCAGSVQGDRGRPSRRSTGQRFLDLPDAVCDAR
jgi:hypothetical protein